MTIFIASRNFILFMDGTFAIHEQHIKHLTIEMFKALNDRSTPDFSELSQLNEWLIWLKVKWTSKNFAFPISTLLDLVKVLLDTLVQWSGILYQQKLGMLILCHLLRKKFENGSHQIVNVDFVQTFCVEMVLQTLENNWLWR